MSVLYTTPFNRPSKGVISEATIKRSRFISLIEPVSSRDLAQAFIQEQRQKHAQARHHCWAFIAGHPSDSQCLGFSDDGEPSGTAGKPMLAQLQGSGLGELVAVVIRYSGGIKLGTGGLVKAYGGGVQQALSQIETSPWLARCQCRLSYDYAQASLVEGVLNRYSVEKLSADFNLQTELMIALPLSDYPTFKQQLLDACRGTISIIKQQA